MANSRSVVQRTLLERMFLMPFRPDFWRDSPGYRFFPLFLSLVGLMTLAALPKGYAHAQRLAGFVHRVAASFEWNVDPILLENGRFSAMGPRSAFAMSEGDLSFLVDLEGSVSESAMPTRYFAAIRSDAIVSRVFLHTTRTEASTLVEDGERVVIDSAFLREFADGGLTTAVVAVYLWSAPYALLSLCLFILPVALVLWLCAGWLGLGLGYRGCLNIALATASSAIVMDAVLVALGGFMNLGIAQILLMLGLGLVALGMRTGGEPVPGGVHART